MEAKRIKEKAMLSVINNPKSTIYWAEGYGGKGGAKPWKFACMCGEVSYSYVFIICYKG